MVLSNGSKMARGAGKIINRETCGGNDKAGLVSTIGRQHLTKGSRRYASGNCCGVKFSMKCDNTKGSVQNQRTGYRATLG